MPKLPPPNPPRVVPLRLRRRKSNPVRLRFPSAIKNAKAVRRNTTRLKARFKHINWRGLWRKGCAGSFFIGRRDDGGD